MASITTSAPNPPVSSLIRATASSFLELTTSVAPNPRAQPSLRSSTSTAMIVRAPASQAPRIAPSPTPPQPITATLSPLVTPPVLIAAPMPAITPQPSSPAVAAGQCTKVNPAIDPATAGLLGCGVMAGIGAAINTGAVTRGDSVAVIGCGGVGDGAIAGAYLAGARTIIAVDVDDRKLEWARGFGATEVVNSKNEDPVARIRELTGGFGADVVIEAIGRPETYEQAFYARDLAGTVVLVGVPTPELRLELPLLDVFGRGGALKSSWYGDCLPSRDFPMLVDLHLDGRLPLDKFVSETIGLGDVEEAFARMGRGEVLRSVVIL